VTKGRGGMRIVIIRLVIFHSDKFSGLTLFSVLLHRSFLHSLSWLVTHLCRWCTFAFEAGFRVIATAFLAVSSCVVNLEHEPVMGAVGQDFGDTGEWDLLR